MLPALLNWLGWGLLRCLFRLIVVHLWRAVTRVWQGDELAGLTSTGGRWGGKGWGSWQGLEKVRGALLGQRWGQRGGGGKGKHPKGFSSVTNSPGNKQPSQGWASFIWGWRWKKRREGMERKQQVKQFPAKFTRFIGLQSYRKTWCCLGWEFWIKYPSHLLDTIFSAPMSQALGTSLLVSALAAKWWGAGYTGKRVSA